MDFRTVDFGLFRMLVERVTWEKILKGKGVQEGWTFFKEEVLKGTEAGCPHVLQDEPSGEDDQPG